MRTADLMSRAVVTVRPEESLAHAAERMHDRSCGCVVVVDTDFQPVGMLTDRDLCLAAWRLDKPMSAIRVAEAMHGHVYVCRTDDSVGQAEDVMALHQIRRLPVVDAFGRLEGLLSLDDIAREARRSEDLFAPAVSCAAVGRTLGQICRPHLVTGAEE